MSDSSLSTAPAAVQTMPSGQVTVVEAKDIWIGGLAALAVVASLLSFARPTSPPPPPIIYVDVAEVLERSSRDLSVDSLPMSSLNTALFSDYVRAEIDALGDDYPGSPVFDASNLLVRNGYDATSRVYSRSISRALENLDSSGLLAELSTAGAS